ncbi:unnamed protein product [Timema podura]|uniref:Uncharacterized protein n=1 Tax=Timema podura TaxID=61482 RepID=A0ABN7PLU1_TIMPD|nr:unnamed protein product [Timema podura]
MVLKLLSHADPLTKEQLIRGPLNVASVEAGVVTSALRYGETGESNMAPAARFTNKRVKEIRREQGGRCYCQPIISLWPASDVTTLGLCVAVSDVTTLYLRAASV